MRAASSSAFQHVSSVLLHHRMNPLIQVISSLFWRKSWEIVSNLGRLIRSFVFPPRLSLSFSFFPFFYPPLKGLMESWSNVSGNYCHSRRNSRRSDPAVHRSSALLLSTPGTVPPINQQDTFPRRRAAGRQPSPRPRQTDLCSFRIREQLLAANSIFELLIPTAIH